MHIGESYSSTSYYDNYRSTDRTEIQCSEAQKEPQAQMKISLKELAKQPVLLIFRKKRAYELRYVRHIPPDIDADFMEGKEIYDYIPRRWGAK